jgi:lipopolysaccharide transport system ATP-binding protein
MSIRILQMEKARTSQEESIVISGVSKRYRIPMEKRLTIYEKLMGAIKGSTFKYETFWALKNISFTVRKGETLGIIGPNGSGKSTLLKLLAGVLYPDSGSIRINGKIAPFLEFGVGFQPELTARENIFMYGAIMGLTKKEVIKKYEDILDFAELNHFENMKLRSFSPGMYVRLAFSIAIQSDPDILLLDEVFAVGDEHFQKKCTDKIEEIRKSGKTIVFVSHSMESVKSLCERSILISGGKIVASGRTEYVIGQYIPQISGTMD